MWLEPRCRASFEQVEMAGQIGGDIGARIVDRITHPGLGAQMDDAVEFECRQRAIERLMVGEVDALEAKPSVCMAQARRAGPASAADRNNR